MFGVKEVLLFNTCLGRVALCSFALVVEVVTKEVKNRSVPSSSSSKSA